MRLQALLLLPALLAFASSARAQETFGSGHVDDAAAPTPPPAPVVVPMAPGTDEWWRPTAPSPAWRPHPPNPMALRLDGGYGVRRLFSFGITGADLGLALGVQTSQHVAWWATSRVSIGSSEGGLSVWSGRLGAEVEAVFDPVRFGIGTGVMVLGVQRAARDETLNSYGLEARAFVRIDCTRNDDIAVFLRAGIDGAAEIKGDSAFWGPTIGAGVELGVRGKKPPEWAVTPPPIPML